jgi:O-succinylbenzoate synthase
MKIESVELRRLQMPLVNPFRTSFGLQTVRDVLLVFAITTDGVTGYGECVALADPVYSEEYVDGAEQVIANYLAPAVLAGGDVTAADVARLTENFVGQRMAKAAVEMAVLDAQLRTTGMNLSAYLGGVRTSVDVGVSVGITPTIDQLLEVVHGHLEEGYHRIKLKIKPGFDLEPVAAVREAFGPDVMLQVDANTAYRAEALGLLTQLDAFELLLVEQPFDHDDIELHAELARRMRTPICLDESLTSAKTTAAAIRAGACEIANIKPGRVGGFLEARRIHDIAGALDVPVWCGGMLETGIGRAANLALASLPGFTLPGDISGSARYYREDITAPFVAHDGQMAVPTGPGIGVEIDGERIRSLTTSHRVLTR